MIKHFAFAASLLTAFTAAAAQQTPADLSITRLDCGRAPEAWPLNAFDDTGAASAEKKAIVSSCYLIRHGDRLMIWDTGIAPETSGSEDAGFVLDKTLVAQLAELGIVPDKIEFIGISHYHYDHIGQAKFFPAATLLIGDDDLSAIKANPPPANVDPKDLAPWLGGAAKVEAVSKDKDVFGDRSVVMLDMPGHTPGHHALLVRLPKTGPVLLTGDLAHFSENYVREGVPTFNYDRADTLASFDRFKKMAANLGATVIIQHEPADVAKLPSFPAAAR